MTSVVKNGQQIPVVSNGHTSIVNGVPVIKTGGIPIGAQCGATGGPYILGADELGRDVVTRLLYGGRNSLFIGVTSAAITTIVAVILALLAGYFGGGTDWVISRFFDLIWAFPVILLGIALGTALSVNGFHHLGINLSGSSLWITIGVVAFVFIPYIGRPLRGQILALRQREFVEAATAQGAGPIRIMFTEVLPNIASTVLVLFTLIIAACILTEVGLLLPRSGRPGSEPVVGHDDRGRAEPAGDGSADQPLRRSRDRGHRARHQHLRRRPARRARSAREGQDRALGGMS